MANNRTNSNFELNIIGRDSSRSERPSYQSKAASSGKDNLNVPLSARQKKYSNLNRSQADGYNHHNESRTASPNPGRTERNVARTAPEQSVRKTPSRASQAGYAQTRTQAGTSQTRTQTSRPQTSASQARTQAGRPQVNPSQARTQAGASQARTQAGRPQVNPSQTRTQAGASQARTQAGRPQANSSQARTKANSVQKTSAPKGPRKNKKKDIFAIILLALQGVLSVGLIIVLAMLNVLPTGWFLAAIGVLIVLWGVVFLTQFKGRKKIHIIGKILSILLCIILAVGNYYVIITNKAIATVSDETVFNYTYLDVAVLKDDPAQKITDAKDYTFGTQATYQPLNLNKAITEIEDEIGTSLKTKDYDTVLKQVDALYNKEVPIIIYNRNFKGTIIEKHEKFDEEVRVIKTVTIKEQLNIKSNSDVDVTTQPFLFYISGNDEYGELTIEGRSDVNMLVAVNPNSRQVLMVTTPRDYYVELPGVSNGMRDKLTHAGVYGTQCQLDTMAELYGYPIDYYCKVNFSSLIDIVDAIGGVDVYNEQEFEFDNSDGLIFEQGDLHLDGYRALCFCRERNSFEDGDFARARHQQAVIEAIINKLLSTTGFTAYSQLIKTLEKCCVTNMPKDSISALVKKQLAEGGGWTISKAAAEGEGYMQTTYSMGDMALSVIIPYAQSLRNITGMLDQLYNGEEVVVRQMGDDDDYSLVVQPGPVPEQEERDEDGNTIERVSLVDNNGVVFGTRIRHIDPDTGNVVREELVDTNGSPLSEEEVAERMNGGETEPETETETEPEPDTEPETESEEDEGDN